MNSQNIIKIKNTIFKKNWFCFQKNMKLDHILFDFTIFFIVFFSYWQYVNNYVRNHSESSSTESSSTFWSSARAPSKSSFASLSAHNTVSCHHSNQKWPWRRRQWYCIRQPNNYNESLGTVLAKVRIAIFQCKLLQLNRLVLVVVACSKRSFRYFTENYEATISVQWLQYEKNLKEYSPNSSSSKRRVLSRSPSASRIINTRDSSCIWNEIIYNSL